MDDELERLRTSLLHGLRVEVGPRDGDIAFERHVLLAVRFHRAAGLNQTVDGEGAGWRQYFAEHFPKRADYEAKDAQLLWTAWRVGLLKWETPKAGVTVTHRAPFVHWYHEPDGTLCINLESMWDDFEASVESFIRLLRRDAGRRATALSRWRERSWTVRPLVMHATVLASVSSSYAATAMGPLPQSYQP